MKLGILAVLAIAGCGASSKMAGGSSGAAPMTAASPPIGPPSDTDAANGATIAIAEPRRPAPGQLTAGVWDDNQNFEFFAGYALRMARLSQDLSAFGADEQRAARDAFAQIRGEPRRELDIQLVLDTTGSMGDELAYLQSELDSIATQVRTRFPDLAPRWSLVVYKDRGDAYVTRPFEFTADTRRFQRDLAAQSAGGGGDFPEAVIPALEHGLARQWRTGDEVAKLVLWVADAPPHPGEGGRLAELARTARDRGIRIYPIASSGIDDATEYQMRATAQLTGGRYIFLTDDSRIGNSHAEPHIPCYAVTRLDHAVVRAIESELTGRRAEVRAEQVLRRVGAPDAAGRCTHGDAQVVAF